MGAPETTNPVEVGDLVAGKYRVERVLGKGGMGLVVAAIHVELAQHVAVKFLLPGIGTSPPILARFEREARAAAGLHSEHVTRVLDVGRLPNGCPYMVMEMLEGTDLAELLRARRRLPPHKVVGYLLEACDAIAEAHEAGIVHRDIKPVQPGRYGVHRHDDVPRGVRLRLPARRDPLRWPPLRRLASLQPVDAHTRRRSRLARGLLRRTARRAAPLSANGTPERVRCESVIWRMDVHELLGMMLGMTKAKIAVTLPRPLLAKARRAVKEGRAESVSAYVAAALEEKAKLDDLKGMLDEMLMETGGPATPAERREAERMLGLRPRRKRGRAA